MDWEFDHASDGNIALTGELDLIATASSRLALLLEIPNTTRLRHCFRRWASRLRSITNDTPSNGTALPRTSFP